MISCCTHPAPCFVREVADKDASVEPRAPVTSVSSVGAACLQSVLTTHDLPCSKARCLLLHLLSLDSLEVGCTPMRHDVQTL